MAVSKYNGIRTKRGEDKKTLFIPLPREAWVECGPCGCSHCKGAVGYWDTLAVDTSNNKKSHRYTWTVHAPELQALA